MGLWVADIQISSSLPLWLMMSGGTKLRMPTEIPGTLSHQGDCQLRVLPGLLRGSLSRDFQSPETHWLFVCACVCVCVVMHVGTSTHTQQAREVTTGRSPNILDSAPLRIMVFLLFFLNKLSSSHPLFVQSILVDQVLTCTRHWVQTVLWAVAVSSQLSGTPRGWEGCH